LTEEILLSAIHQEAAQEAETLLEQARQEARKSLEEARRLSDEIETRLVRQRESEFKKRRLRLETQRTLELRQALTTLKAQSIQQALAQAQEAFRSLQKSPAYGLILKKLLKELVAGLGPSHVKVVIHVTPEDEKVVVSTLKELSLKAEVATDLSLDGGLELSDREGDLRLRNTFETRVARSHEALIQKLNELLFHDVRL
jgi:vacuolar-type H+-ATPase subunit E/Vma4